VREQVAAEFIAARLDAGPGRRQQPRLEVTGVIAAHAHELAALECAEQRALRLHGRSSSSLTNNVPAPARFQHAGAICPLDSVPNNTCSAPSPRSVLEISVTNGREARGLASWMKRAKASRPVPVSPTSNTGNRCWRSARDRRAAAA
jgi:hypothetical protein